MGTAEETHPRKKKEKEKQLQQQKKQESFKGSDSYTILMLEIVHNVWCDDTVVISFLR